MERKDKIPRNSDYQTASLFVILALLTSVFVLGLRWALLAPPSRGAQGTNIESASK
jgi:hypothetical protein